MKHFDFETLLQFREKRLHEENELEIRSHTEECAECRAEIRRIDDFLEYVGFHEDPVPQRVTAKLLNVFSPPSRTANKRPKISIPAVVASLVFDDWRQLLAERFDGEDMHQLLFRAGEYEIDIRIDFEGDRCRVMGQIFPDIRSGTAELESEDISSNTDISEHSDFTFENLPCGTYNFYLRSGEKLVSIPGLALTRQV